MSDLAKIIENTCLGVNWMCRSFNRAKDSRYLLFGVLYYLVFFFCVSVFEYPEKCSINKTYYYFSGFLLHSLPLTVSITSKQRNAAFFFTWLQVTHPVKYVRLRCPTVLHLLHVTLSVMIKFYSQRHKVMKRPNANEWKPYFSLLIILNIFIARCKKKVVHIGLDMSYQPFNFLFN